MADPLTAAIASIGAEAGGAFGATLVMYAPEIAAVTLAATSVATISDQQRRARHQAQDALNASFRDRYVMSRSATEARQLVLGRQRVSGPMLGPWSYGTYNEHLVWIVPLAAHEIDAVEAVYFDDEQVLLDGSQPNGGGNVVGVNRRDEFTISAATGTFTVRSAPKAGTTSAVVKYGTATMPLTVTSVTGTSVSVSGASASMIGTLVVSYQPDVSPYSAVKRTTGRSTIALNGSGNGSVALPQTPIDVHVTYNDGTGDNTQSVNLDPYFGVSGTTVTVTGATVTSATADVLYTYDDVTPRARVRIYTGSPWQVADAAMISQLPAGVWTSAHVGNGVAYLVCEADFDPESFPGGVPNISANVRGAKVLDVRTGIVAWSENNALLMRHAAVTRPWGPLNATDINDTSIAVAANVCDVSSVYVVNGQSYTRARYTAGLTVKAGTRCADVLNDLAAAMAGKWSFIDGVMRVKAGAYVTPLQTLDETWLAGGALDDVRSSTQLQAKPTRGELFNIVTGKFADEQQDYQEVDYPRVESSAYITQDGRDLPADIRFRAITFGGQCQQVAAVLMRDARQGVRITLACNLKAFAVELFDNIYVSLSRYGWANKVFEVVGTSFSIAGGIVLTLKETDASIWALGAAFSATDPAPNTMLPPAFVVPDIAGLSVSGGGSAYATTEGMRATWTAATDPGVTQTGGGIELRYGLSSEDVASWRTVTVAGDQTQAFLPVIQPDAFYFVQARAFKPTPNGVARGRWTAPYLVRAAANAVVIDTDQLNDNAATNPQYAFTATETNITSAGWTEIQSLTATFTGGVVEISAGFNFRVTANNQNPDVRVRVDGSDVYSFSGGGSSSGRAPYVAVPPINTTLSAGSHTISLQTNGVLGGGDAGVDYFVSNRALRATEIKR